MTPQLALTGLKSKARVDAIRLEPRLRKLILDAFLQRSPDDPIWIERGHWPDYRPRELYEELCSLEGVTAVQSAPSGLELKEQGIASLERHRWVDDARVAAVALAAHFGTVTSDLLHDVMGTPPHPNCWGAIFHDKRFRGTGQYVKSKRPEAHARVIKVWRLA